MFIGYARVSTQNQNIELQCEALIKAGCKKILKDTISSTKTNRPGLKKALEIINQGDTLIVWKLDRLGRNVKQLINLMSQLNELGVKFKSITDSIDISTARGRFFFHIMASLAEMEHELMVERTLAGLAVAKKQGRTGGRKPKMTKVKIELAKKLLASNTLPKDIASNLEISIPTLYRWITTLNKIKTN